MKQIALRLYAVLIGFWSAWTSWLASAYVLGLDSRHYRVESAWFILAALILVLAVKAILRSERTTEISDRNRKSTLPCQSIFAFVAIAFVVFGPSLSVGLLSDDFVILERARRGVFFGDAQWYVFRPVVLFLWRGVWEIVPSSILPVVLHSLNIGLHGLNSALLAFLVGRFGGGRITAVLAGLTFLVFPIHTEAVTWISGVFDVLLLTWLLLLAMILSTDKFSGYYKLVLVAFLGLIAIGTKETAIAAPILMAIIVIAGDFLPFGKSSWAIAFLLVEAGVYLLWRISQGIPGELFPQLSLYTLKELLSRPFATLGLPFPKRLLETNPLWGLPCAIGLPFLFTTLALRCQRRPNDARVSLALALWILVGVGPVFTLLFVKTDLQNSRYLYISSAAWAFLIAWSLHHFHYPTGKKIGLLIGTGWIVISFIGLWAQQSKWLAAAQARDEVLEQVAHVPDDCVSIAIPEMPDNVDGAYIFRNGLAEAIAMVRPQITLVPSTENIPQQCILQ